VSVTELDPWRILLAVAVAGVLLGLTPWLLRRFRPVIPADGPPRDGLEVVAQRALDMRHRIVVVRYRGNDHLLVLGSNPPLALGRHDVPLASLPASGEQRP
jgi:hypothetical protein